MSVCVCVYWQTKVRELYGSVFELHHQVFVLDCTVTSSAALKAIRNYVADVKTSVTKVMNPSVINHLGADTNISSVIHLSLRW